MDVYELICMELLELGEIETVLSIINEVLKP